MGDASTVAHLLNASTVAHSPHYSLRFAKIAYNIQQIAHVEGFCENLFNSQIGGVKITGASRNHNNGG